jgi:putative SOS response-associated peptidase YedK
MCGRFAQRTSPRELARTFGVAVPEVKARYNIAPTQEVLAVRQQAEARAAVMLRWGLIPAWARDPAIGQKLINARSETVSEKPSFREAFKARRCLVPADGFYEWRREGARKQPYYFQLRDGRPFAFAGLWECWRGADGEPVETCAILTTEANEVLRPVHDRMPVILAPEDYDLWLARRVGNASDVRLLLRPYPAALMTSHPVGRRMNDVRHDDEGCAAHYNLSLLDSRA